MRLPATHPRGTFVALRVPGLPGASAVPVPPPALLRLVSRAFESFAAEPHHAEAWDAVHCTLRPILLRGSCVALHLILQSILRGIRCNAPRTVHRVAHRVRRHTTCRVAVPNGAACCRRC